MTEEILNEEHADNNENITETCLYHTKKGKLTPPNITSPAIMEECEDMIHMDLN